MSPLPQEHGDHCPACGQALDFPCDPEHLSPGTVLEERYLVGRLLRSDWESGVYIGLDLRQKARVWIREYTPWDIARRNHATGFIVPKPDCQARYKSFLEGFRDLNRQLMEAETSSVIRPAELLEANNTAYAVSPYRKTITLGELLERGDGEISWGNAKRLFMPLLASLSQLHKKGIFHGRISPDTILVDQDGRLHLSDFPISQLTADTSGSQESYCYAAPEQFSSSVLPGPLADIYSMAAVLYRCLSGAMPADAPSRISGARFPSLADRSSQIPENVSNTILMAMSLAPEDRPQSMDALIGGLLESEGSNTAVYDAAPLQETQPPSPQKRDLRTFLVIALCFSLVLLGVVLYLFRDLLFPTETEEPQEEELSVEDVLHPVTVPSLIGQAADAVTSNEEYTSQMRFHVEEAYNEQYAAGYIYDQSPPAESRIINMGTVTLYVSRGSQLVDMPDLLGTSLEYAERILEERQILYTVVEQEYEDAEPGLIAETNPEAGEKVRINQQRVTLYVPIDSGDGNEDEETSDQEREEGESSGGFRRQDSTFTVQH